MLANQRKAAPDGAIHALQVVEVGAAGGVAEISVSVTANLHVVAHDAQQHGTVIRQYRVVMQGIADGAARELMGDQRFRCNSS